MTFAAHSITAPSTQPPETAPARSPDALSASFAPGGWGAERLVETTVAVATASPAASQRPRASSSSRMAVPPDQQPEQERDQHRLHARVAQAAGDDRARDLAGRQRRLGGGRRPLAAGWH